MELKIEGEVSAEESRMSGPGCAAGQTGPGPSEHLPQRPLEPWLYPLLPRVAIPAAEHV